MRLVRSRGEGGEDAGSRQRRSRSNAIRGQSIHDASPGASGRAPSSEVLRELANLSEDTGCKPERERGGTSVSVGSGLGFSTLFVAAGHAGRSVSSSL